MSRLPYAVRLLGARIVGSVRTRIQSGPNAGRQWTLASSGRGYRMGVFEAERMRAILSLLRTGDCFWDVGAHKGYVALAAARAVGGSGQVFAFEPSRLNQFFLQQHIQWNAVQNVRVVPLALSDNDGLAAFGGSGSSITYRIGVGNEVVATRTVRSLIESDGIKEPTVLKIDTEGHEGAILRGGLEYLTPHTVVCVSIHGWQQYYDCRSLLLERGFQLYESASITGLRATPDRPWGGDKDLLAVGRERLATRPELAGLTGFDRVAA